MAVTEKYLIDASVLAAYLNEADANHTFSREFFEKHIGEKFFFTPLALFEFEAAASRRKADGTFAGLNVNLGNHTFIPLDSCLFKAAKDDGLFAVFKGLKGADLVYACLAKLRDLTLVTCDRDFWRFTDHIKVHYLPQNRKAKNRRS